MLSFYSEAELNQIGFKELGKNVLLSRKASFYRASEITIGSNSRVDDFCVITGKVDIGKYCHIAPQSIVSGGQKHSVKLHDFSTLAYRVTVFSRSDDYSGEFLTGSVVDKSKVNNFESEVNIQAFSILGTGCVIMPGVTISEGCAIGAMTLVRSSTQPWSIYAGIPARLIKPRSKNCLDL